MKKVSLMVVAALLSAGMFANSASLPKKGTTVNGTKPKTEMSKIQKSKQKPKATASKTKEQKSVQKSPKKTTAHK